MAFRRGFKSEAAGIAADVRSDLKAGLFGRLDPRALADFLDITVIDLSSLETEAPAIRHLLVTEPEVFSAVTVFAGRRRTIVHNDGHCAARQNSNICHELSHGLLQHPPTPAMDDRGCRIWNQDIEDEATWLAGFILVPEQAALATARGNWTIVQAAERFGVSEAMISYRINATGAAIRVRRAALAGRR